MLHDGQWTCFLLFRLFACYRQRRRCHCWSGSDSSLALDIRLDLLAAPGQRYLLHVIFSFCASIQPKRSEKKNNQKLQNDPSGAVWFEYIVSGCVRLRRTSNSERQKMKLAIEMLFFFLLFPRIVIDNERKKKKPNYIKGEANQQIVGLCLKAIRMPNTNQLEARMHRRHRSWYYFRYRIIYDNIYYYVRCGLSLCVCEFISF